MQPRGQLWPPQGETLCFLCRKSVGDRHLTQQASWSLLLATSTGATIVATVTTQAAWVRPRPTLPWIATAGAAQCQHLHPKGVTETPSCCMQGRCNLQLGLTGLWLLTRTGQLWCQPSPPAAGSPNCYFWRCSVSAEMFHLYCRGGAVQHRRPPQHPPHAADSPSRRVPGPLRCARTRPTQPSGASTNGGTCPWPWSTGA